MNFYIDLEALQFSGRIISLGCVASNGKTFYTLMKPSKPNEKINQFITNLTGITNEMLETAPTSEDAFFDFLKWINMQSEGFPTFFFCYGNEDDKFLRATAKYIENPKLKEFILNLSLCISDYSKYVNDFFGIHGAKLKKIWEYFYLQDKEQKHNALEDAKMLAEIATALEKSEKPNKDNIFKLEENKRDADINKKRVNEEKALQDSMINLVGIWEPANVPKGTKTVQEFATLYEATGYFYNKLPKENKAVTTKNTIRRKLKNAILNNKPYMGYNWTCEYKEGDEANV